MSCSLVYRDFQVTVHGRRAGQAGCVRPAATPVADINFPFAKDDVKWRDADIPGPQDCSGRGVQFEQAVGKIASDVNPFAIGGDGDASRDFIRPVKRLDLRQRDGKQRRYFLARAGAKDLDVAADAGHVNPRAVR